MGVVSTFSGLIDNFVRGRGKKNQDEFYKQAYRDAYNEASSFSIESWVARSMAELCCTGLEYQCSGASERAETLDDIGDAFVKRWAVDVVKQGLEFGDCIVVPMYVAGRMEHFIVNSNDFRILGNVGDEITDVVYVTQRKKVSGVRYALLQEMRLETFVADDDTQSTNCVMELHVVDGNGSIVDMSRFPDWAEAYADSWVIPNCNRIPIGRFKSFAEDALEPNGVYGVPICHGASQFIREIHYLIDQMHNEFELSEKGVIADKTMFVKSDDDTLSLPRGRQRLFMKVNNGSRSLDAQNKMEEWAPTIQYTPYEEAIEQQLRMVERAVGIDSGVISKTENSVYQNTDDVRKSSQKTQSFVETARNRMEGCLDQLTEAWSIILNYVGLPTGEYTLTYAWSDDYINTFADQKQALVDGYAMGAIDALDYRLFILGESVEEATRRVEEISAKQSGQLVLSEA